MTSPQDPHEIEGDLLDIALASARMLSTGDGRTSLDEVLASFGYTREQLRDLDDRESLTSSPRPR
jgi:hypothetical protein